MSFGPAALTRLAEEIHAEGEPLSLRAQWRRPGADEAPAVAYREDDPCFGELVAAGPRSVTASPGGPEDAGQTDNRRQYAFVVEAIREGYLCHYGESRLLALPDPDLGLLAGDLLYAIGLNNLSALGDLESTGILSDLIRVAADLRAGGDPDAAEQLWVIQTTAVSCGKPADYDDLLGAVATGSTGALTRLFEWAETTADRAGIGPEFRVASKPIHLRPSNL